jgi:hypothetical protein
MLALSEEKLEISLFSNGFHAQYFCLHDPLSCTAVPVRYYGVSFIEYTRYKLDEFFKQSVVE